MPDHKEQPASALAHGAAKSSDIERVRRDVDNAAEARLAQDDRASAARQQQRIRDRAARNEPDARP